MHQVSDGIEIMKEMWVKFDLSTSTGYSRWNMKCTYTKN